VAEWDANLTDGTVEQMFFVVDEVTVTPADPGLRLTLHIETQEGVRVNLYFPRHALESLRESSSEVLDLTTPRV
jgi:hypothetical protein